MDVEEGTVNRTRARRVIWSVKFSAGSTPGTHLTAGMFTESRERASTLVLPPMQEAYCTRTRKLANSRDPKGSRGL